MAKAYDKSITELDTLAISKSGHQQHVNDMFLISHPLTQPQSSDPRDYVTYNMALSDVAALISASIYDAVSSQISSDLNLGDLAHQNKLTASSQAGQQVIVLSENLKSSSYGPLARPISALQPISTFVGANATLSTKLGLGDLAFKNEYTLKLSALSHKDKIISSDLDGKLVSSQIDLKFKNLCLSDEYMLKLSALAHQDTISAWQITDQISIGQLKLEGQGGWHSTLNNYYLSAATASTRGSIQVGYVQSSLSGNRNYAVRLDENKNAYVTVPWKYDSTNASYKLSASTTSANTLVFTEHIAVDRSGDVSTTDNISAITLQPYIANNITMPTSSSGGQNGQRHIAMFCGPSQISAGIKLTGNKTDVFRGDGTFEKILTANGSTNGLMTSANYRYLYGLSAALCRKATDQFGMLKTGYSESNENYAVQLNDNGQAFVHVPTPTIDPSALDTNKMFIDFVKALYPISAIYITVASTCPFNGLGGMSWQKIEGAYLFASGELTLGETYNAGVWMQPGLPDHDHSVSVDFSAASETSGYPHHGGPKACKHDSFSFNTSLASACSIIYGASNTVRPKGYAVNVYKRIA